MKIILKALAITAFSLTVSTSVAADPKPSWAKPPDAQTLAKLYVGRTQTWKNCDGGIYYGGQWQAQAYCAREGKAVGLGKWRVSSRGRVCHDLSWYWPQDEGYGSKSKPRECVSHLVDTNGTIWRNWEKDNEWWQMRDGDMKKRFLLKGKVNRLRKKLKI